MAGGKADHLSGIIKKHCWYCKADTFWDWHFWMMSPTLKIIPQLRCLLCHYGEENGSPPTLKEKPPDDVSIS